MKIVNRINKLLNITIEEEDAGEYSPGTTTSDIAVYPKRLPIGNIRRRRKSKLFTNKEYVNK
jgi:hypothetical protein